MISELEKDILSFKAKFQEDLQNHLNKYIGDNKKRDPYTKYLLEEGTLNAVTLFFAVSSMLLDNAMSALSVIIEDEEVLDNDKEAILKSIKRQLASYDELLKR